jgi:hypothetical protein
MEHTELISVVIKAALEYTILYYTILYYTILYYTILYYTILYYTILYCTVLTVTLFLCIRDRENICFKRHNRQAHNELSSEETSTYLQILGIIIIIIIIY